jgi:hypothetical protein
MLVAVLQAPPAKCLCPVKTEAAGGSIPPAASLGEIPTWWASGISWRVISWWLVGNAVAAPVAMSVRAATPLCRRLRHAYQEGQHNDETEQAQKTFHSIILHPTASINDQSLSIAFISRRRSNPHRFQLQDGFGPDHSRHNARVLAVNRQRWRLAAMGPDQSGRLRRAQCGWGPGEALPRRVTAGSVTVTMPLVGSDG